MIRDLLDAHLGSVPNGGAPPLDLPDHEDFWTARPVLASLRTFARARRCSPWAMLGAVLARVVCAVPYTVKLPALVGGHASLNLAVALVGASGGGKGAAEAAAEEFLCVPADSFDRHRLGSGQGLAHGFLRSDAKTQETSWRTRSCLFRMDEVDTIAGAARQKGGSTLLSELRSALMGERLGHLYADSTRRLEVPDHEYRLALTVGVQPERAGVLLDDVAGGTPQRFVWLPVIDPKAPEVAPLEPPGCEWRAPSWPSPPTLDVCSEAAREIEAARLERLRGIGAALDGHALLTREKVAAALDILSGRAEVSAEGWRLAGTVMAVSDATRESCRVALNAASQRENAVRGAREADRAVMSSEAVEEAAIQRTCTRVLHCLSDGEWQVHAPLRKRLKSTERANFGEAIERLLAAAQVVAEEVSGQGESGRRYRLAAAGGTV